MDRRPFHEVWAKANTKRIEGKPAIAEIKIDTADKSFTGLLVSINSAGNYLELDFATEYFVNNGGEAPRIRYIDMAAIVAFCCTFVTRPAWLKPERAPFTDDDDEDDDVVVDPSKEIPSVA